MRSLGDKVKDLRKSRNISQMDLAAFIGTKPDKIVEVEAGREEYNPRHIRAIEELFDIVGMPLEESKRPAFVMRLYLWRAYARNERMINEAIKMRDEMAKVVNLESCDYDLAMQYKLFDIQMLITESNFTAAEEKFCSLKGEIGKFSNENLFHYYYCEGYLGLQSKQYEEGLGCFLKAYELLENNDDFLPDDDKTYERLLYIIAWCYNCIAMPHRAKSFLLKAKEIYSENMIDDLGFYIDSMLAWNYITTNELKDAEKLLSKCLVKAQSVNDDLLVGLAMHDFGRFHKKNKNWEIAIAYYNHALHYLHEGSEQYLSALYNKIHCLIDAREFPEAQKLLEQAKIRYHSDETWAIYFNALWHYRIVSRRISVRNYESTDYIENVAIPCFEKNYDYFFILDFCKLLESHYEEVKSYRNSLLMSKKIKEIYERCFVNYY